MVTPVGARLPGRWPDRDLAGPGGWPAGDPYAAVAAEARALRAGQRLAVAAGAAALLPPLVLAVAPGPGSRLVATVLGGWLLVAGVLRLVEAGIAAETAGSPTLLTLAGLLHVIAGVMCLRNLLHSAELLAVGVGIAWLAGGVSEVMSAVTGGRGSWPRLGALAAGALGVTGGLLLAFWPQVSLGVIVWVAGGWWLAMAAVQGCLALRASRPAAP